MKKLKKNIFFSELIPVLLVVFIAFLLRLYYALTIFPNADEARTYLWFVKKGALLNHEISQLQARRLFQTLREMRPPHGYENLYEKKRRAFFSGACKGTARSVGKQSCCRDAP